MIKFILKKPICCRQLNFYNKIFKNTLLLDKSPVVLKKRELENREKSIDSAGILWDIRLVTVLIQAAGSLKHHPINKSISFVKTWIGRI